MDKQISLSYLNDELAQVRTKKKEFLAQIEQIIPWGEWGTIIQPFYYKGERGNKPYGLNLMLHLHILQNLYDLSDEATRVEVIDSRAFSEFCGVESSNQAPGAREIICTRQGGACFRCGQRIVSLQKNVIPRFAEADRKVEYDVCFGKSLSSGQARLVGLI